MSTLWRSRRPAIDALCGIGYPDTADGVAAVLCVRPVSPEWGFTTRPGVPAASVRTLRAHRVDFRDDVWMTRALVPPGFKGDQERER
ncbi:hypothetical protein AGR3A_Cc240003 [Agrobacterium tomkonis CFBP 6623]|uniref:Uncharacterized protein n=1 Tax=Agrobacterium tomkonis CFBP 6623 TaxID=1183432 RepID=A0A1S7PBL4_9HYPH|nr:hypothetical protein AGR3A_Cc240003 [Agrobacterium tomkonis CFBP 6623]